MINSLAIGGKFLRTWGLDVRKGFRFVRVNFQTRFLSMESIAYLAAGESPGTTNCLQTPCL